MTIESICLGFLIAFTIVALMYLVLKVAVSMYGEPNKHGCNNRMHWALRMDGHIKCKYCNENLHDET